MSPASTGRRRPSGREADTAEQTPEQHDLWYVYGITFEDVKVPEALEGLDDRPVDLIRSGGLAAIVSEFTDGKRIGKKVQLLAHSRVLDSIAAKGTVLPLRFGTVVADRSTLASQVLEPGEERFTQMLNGLKGRSQYTLQARYDEQKVLAEIVREDPQIAELREQTRGAPEDTTLNARLRLGELVSVALQNKRESDVPAVLKPVLKHAVAHSVRDSGYGVEHLVDVALLIDDDHWDEFDRAAEGVARALAGRVRLKLLGPTAPYDFVAEL
ncbi:GvpL/GvpF family gas vesicle protein [Kribbella sp. NPDC026611]|uniref:GvpL/GvpF family gas vesicle protein n=1 Tax=Kribbella sp. NPDC026611 TaxID=3154911 RepID=UPI0033E4B209